MDIVALPNGHCDIVWKLNYNIYWCKRKEAGTFRNGVCGKVTPSVIVIFAHFTLFIHSDGQFFWRFSTVSQQFLQLLTGTQ